MPYKMKENERLRGIVLPIPLWEQVTQTALLLQIPLRIFIEEALDNMVDSKMDDLATSMEAGKGVLGLVKKHPDKFKAAMDELRDNPMTEPTEPVLKNQD